MIASRVARSSSTSLRPELFRPGTRPAVRRRRGRLVGVVSSPKSARASSTHSRRILLSSERRSRARHPRVRLVGASSPSGELRERCSWFGGSVGACDRLVGLVGGSGQHATASWGSSTAHPPLRVGGNGAGASTASRASSVARGRCGAVQGPATGSRPRQALGGRSVGSRGIRSCVCPTRACSRSGACSRAQWPRFGRSRAPGVAATGPRGRPALSLSSRALSRSLGVLALLKGVLALVRRLVVLARRRGRHAVAASSPPIAASSRFGRVLVFSREKAGKTDR